MNNFKKTKFDLVSDCIIIDATHDLHFTLDGSITPLIVERAGFGRDIAEKFGRECVLSNPVIEPREFFDIFDRVHNLFTDAQSVAILFAEMFRQAATNGITHLELRFGCGALSRRLGISEQECLQILRTAVRQAEEYRLHVVPTLCFSRHESPERALFLAGFACENRDFIRAIDLEGPDLESGTPCNVLARHFENLKSKGMRVTVHAGEFDGPAQVRDAIDMLGAERIGHGLAAIQDANLLGQLQRKKIAVEICLSSNYLTGAWKDEHFHPLIRFMEAGVPCIICTDDAGIFNTDLKREYHLAAEILKRHVGISELPAALTELTENARTFAFDPKVEV